MKSRILFALSLITFFNPISVMAEGLRSYKVDSKMACTEYARSHKAGAVTATASAQSTTSSGRTSGSLSTKKKI